MEGMSPRPMGRGVRAGEGGSVPVRAVAEHVSGRVDGDGDQVLTGVAAVDDAGPRDLTFVVGESYTDALRDSRPGAVLVPHDLEVPAGETVLIRVDDARASFARAVRLFHPEPEPEPGVAETAVLGDGVEMGDGVTVGQHAVLGDEVKLGARSWIGPHVVVEDGVEIGEECRVGAGCVLQRGSRLGDRVVLHPGARVGSEGFGWVLSESTTARKMPQVGGCVLEDDVEVGANSTIDRGTLEDTVVGAGTKIDNLVHVGHNVRIGRNCMIVAQVGLAGSARVGDGVRLAGQAGISGHLEIGDGARVAAQAGVIGDVPEGATYSGYPARPHGEAMRASAALLRLPEALRRLKALEDRLEEAVAAGGGEEGR